MRLSCAHVQSTVSLGILIQRTRQRSWRRQCVWSRTCRKDSELPSDIHTNEHHPVNNMTGWNTVNVHIVGFYRTVEDKRMFLLDLFHILIWETDPQNGFRFENPSLHLIKVDKSDFLLPSWAIWEQLEASYCCDSRHVSLLPVKSGCTAVFNSCQKPVGTKAKTSFPLKKVCCAILCPEIPPSATSAASTLIPSTAARLLCFFLFFFCGV